MGKNAFFKLIEMDRDKFCVQWNEFEGNFQNSFKVLRNQEKLFDVTLATDDGHQVQAHKVILSAGSDFFCDIFTRCIQSNMFIYLKGIGRKVLENIIEFLYIGETFVTHEEFNAFLEIAKELKVKGLRSSEAKIDGSMETRVITASTSKPKVNVIPDNIESEDRKLESTEFNLQDPIKEDSISDLLTASDNEPEFVAKNEESLNEQVDKLFEQQMGVWKCKMCEKTSNRRENIKAHAETHIGGLRFTCNVCMKNFASRISLSHHVQFLHNSKKLYSCSGCGKVNMNRKAVYNHKRYCNGSPEEQINML